MKALRVLAGLALALSLSACMTTEVPSRNASPQLLSVAAKDGVAMTAPQYDVTQVRVRVPEKLRVSEANVFYPLADIVWCGDVGGNRHAQVKTILEEGLVRGTAAMTKGRAVVVEAEVTRFHSLTEKTRYTVGGTHSVHFVLTLRDAQTGAVIDGPRHVNASVKGSGGALAIAEEQAGRSMRVVIVEHLAAVIAAEMAKPVPQVEDALTSQGTIQPNAGLGALY
jgi:hypothetical protein